MQGHQLILGLYSFYFHGYLLDSILDLLVLHFLLLSIFISISLLSFYFSP
jgi:hypothetical protein